MMQLSNYYFTSGICILQLLVVVLIINPFNICTTNGFLVPSSSLLSSSNYKVIGNSLIFTQKSNLKSKDDGDVYEDDFQGDSDEMDEDDEALMAAFDGLDALGSLDGPATKTKDIKIEQEDGTTFNDMIKDLNSISSSTEDEGSVESQPIKKSAEEEIKLYAEMLGELSNKGEEGIYDDLRLDLTASGYTGLQNMLESIEEDENDEEVSLLCIFKSRYLFFYTCTFKTH